MVVAYIIGEYDAASNIGLFEHFYTSNGQQAYFKYDYVLNLFEQSDYQFLLQL